MSVKILNVTEEFIRGAGRQGGQTDHHQGNGRGPGADRAGAWWCRRRGSTSNHIEPGAPWQNPFVESYKWHLRKELLDLDPLDLVLEAQVLIDDWREEYKTTAPTSRAAPSRRWSSPAGGGWRTKPESQIWWTDEKGRVRGWRNDQPV